MREKTRNRVAFDGWILEPYSPKAIEHGFDCGNEDLNDFFVNDVADYEKTLLAKTYTLSPEKASVERGYPPIGFISFCNDAIIRERVEKLGSKSQWRKLVKEVHYQKRFDSLPAVKIARLGVQKIHQGHGAGTALLNMTKRLFLTNNRTGCRYLTVDAYASLEAIKFYEKNHFQFITRQEQDRSGKLLNISDESSGHINETVSMFYDLSRTTL